MMNEWGKADFDVITSVIVGPSRWHRFRMWLNRLLGREYTVTYGERVGNFVHITKPLTREPPV